MPRNQQLPKEMKNINSHLKAIAQSYDRAIELGRNGIDSYNNLPEYLMKDPDYINFQTARENGLDSDSGRIEIKAFLSPAVNARFVDLGCCLNLMFNGYDQWPSTYYGVDISTETIKLLREFSEKKRLRVGMLHCGSIHEYYEKAFVREVLIEIHRILKPYSKFVLDIPDHAGKMRHFMNLVETSMGRPDKFDMSMEEFEEILLDFFEIEKREKIDAVSMVQYFLKRKA